MLKGGSFAVRVPGKFAKRIGGNFHANTQVLLSDRNIGNSMRMILCIFMRTP